MTLLTSKPEKAPTIQTCDNCKELLPLRVYHGSGGWFVGTVCRNHECVNCNTLTNRLSHYYESEREAKRALNNGTVRWLANISKPVL